MGRSPHFILFKWWARLKWLKWHPKNAQFTSDGSKDQILAQDLADLIMRSARHLPFQTTCLVQALACAEILRAHSLAWNIRIGVKTTPEEMVKAHAWVEHDGVVILGGKSPDQQFVRMQ